MSDCAYEAIEQYGAAEDEINRRYETAYEWDIDDAHYKWVYDRTDSGDFVPRDPAAPPWSWDAFRAELDPEAPEGYRQAFEENLRTGVGLFVGRAGDPTVAHLSKSPDLDAQYDRLASEREDRIAAIDDLEEKLRQQRIREWTAYGEALKTRIETMAASTPGLDVPVHVTVDAETYRMGAARVEEFWNSLESRLIDAAVLDTPTPVDLPGNPLERLERGRED